MTGMFFSYDHEDGIEFHDTADEARARAEMALNMDRDAEDWDEHVTDICWGAVKGRVVEDKWVDYALKDTRNNMFDTVMRKSESQP